MKQLHLLAAAVLACGLVPAVQAQEPGEPAFLCTGISEDDRTEAEASTDHTLKLVYAQSGGNYLGDVTTRLADAEGQVLLETTCEGPWLLVDLPQGSYEVTATFNGESKTENVSVQSGSVLEHTILF